MWILQLLSFQTSLSNLEPQRIAKIQEEAYFRRRGNEENLGNLEENLRKKWGKFIRKFEEVFEKISETVKKILRTSK